MDETTHRELMQLSATSRVSTADTSETAAPSAELDLSDMLELSLEALLQHFRRD